MHVGDTTTLRRTQTRTIHPPPNKIGVNGCSDGSNVHPHDGGYDGRADPPNTKGFTFNWEEHHQEAFDGLKQALVGRTAHIVGISAPRQ